MGFSVPHLVGGICPSVCMSLTIYSLNIPRHLNVMVSFHYLHPQFGAFIQTICLSHYLIDMKVQMDFLLSVLEWSGIGQARVRLVLGALIGAKLRG